MDSQPMKHDHKTHERLQGQFVPALFAGASNLTIPAHHLAQFEPA